MTARKCDAEYLANGLPDAHSKRAHVSFPEPVCFFLNRKNKLKEEFNVTKEELASKSREVLHHFHLGFKTFCYFLSIKEVVVQHV